VSAEKVKAELEAYVATRTWRLELGRKRQELASAADNLVRMQEDLNANEARLGAEVTQLSPATIQTLDALLEPRPRVKISPEAIWGAFVRAGA
jgi:hypothetical protein